MKEEEKELFIRIKTSMEGLNKSLAELAKSTARTMLVIDVHWRMDLLPDRELYPEHVHKARQQYKFEQFYCAKNAVIKLN